MKEFHCNKCGKEYVSRGWLVRHCRLIHHDPLAQFAGFPTKDMVEDSLFDISIDGDRKT